jgi:hypothetical protein
MTWLWHLIPLFIGAGFGWFACALCVMASETKQEPDKGGKLHIWYDKCGNKICEREDTESE